MSRRLALAALALALLCPAAARAQTGCSVLPQASLLAPFADNVAAGSITPSAVRNAICSALNPLNNLGDLTNPALGLSNLGGLAPSGVLSGSPNVVVTPNVGARTATVGTTNPINFQGGATYSVQATDAGQEVEMTDASSATAVTLPQAGTAGFTSGFVATVCALTQPSTVAAAVGTVNGLASLPLQPFQCADLRSNGTQWLAAASAGFASASQVANTAALRAASTATYPLGVTRLTDGAAGAPPLPFSKDTAGICSADDGGHCVAAAGGGYWLAQFPAGGADAREWGAMAGGTVDAEPAISACALASTRCLVQGIANGASVNYRLAETLVIPEGHELDGVGFAPGWTTPGPVGATLVCDLNVTPCILAGQASAPPGNSPRGSVTLRDIIQSRAVSFTSGIPTNIPSGSVGILNAYDQEVVDEDIYATNDDTCLEYLSNTPTGSGVQAHADHIWTANCTTTHVENNGWPVIVMHDVKLGSGTGPEVPSTNYFLMTGSAVSLNAGPSSMTVDQFMAFGSDVINFANFQDCANCNPIGGQVGQTGAGQWWFTNGHVEGICNIVTTDSSVTDLHGFKFDNSSVYGTSFAGCTTPNFFNLDPATVVDAMNIDGNQLLINGNLTTTQPIFTMSITNNILNQAIWVINGAVGSQVSVFGNLPQTFGANQGKIFLTGGPYVNLQAGSPMSTAVSQGAKTPLLQSTTGPNDEHGEIVITNILDGGTASYLVGGGSLTFIGSSKPSSWSSSPTCTPASGAQSVCYDSSLNMYSIANNTGVNLTYTWTPTISGSVQH